MAFITTFLGDANNFLYTYILVALLAVTGIYFTVRTKFVQFRMVPDAIRTLKEKGEGKQVSSFQALMISTASRVGIGNIAGVATAIALGGAGAVFWMWLMAIIGGASAFIESTLAQIYKVRHGQGFVGGPAYYIQQVLGSRPLGILFSILLIACFAYGFNPLQSYTATSALQYYVGEDFASTIVPVVVGGILALATAVVIFGGVHRIGFITSYVVPAMAIIYMGLGLFIILKNVGLLPTVFADIFRNAFDFKAFLGGFAGSAMVLGIKRGLFSNEAGMGSAPNAAATATVSHPVKQGMVQVLSVFIDTLLICTTTAFIILVSGVQGSESLNALPLVQAAMKAQLGEWGIHFITISIFAFAFTSLIGNYCYTETNLLYIKDSKVLLNVFRVTVVLAVFFGAQAGFSTVWDLADVLMGLMALLNIVVILLIGNRAIKAMKDYKRQKDEGKDPVFVAEDAGITDCQEWKK